MRKLDNSTSQDGVDTSSITSAVENEVKKTLGLKSKRTSIKRKMPNFSHDSDDTVIEPLLQPERKKSDNSTSAKFLMSKSKTDSGSERSDNVFIESKVEKISPTSTTPLSENTTYTSKVKETPAPKVSAPIHNHMNTNVFGGLETTKTMPIKTAVIVEIEKSRGSSYIPGPLIFTTAKIHTDNKTKQMEPVQVTPVPILSTIEGSVIKPVPCVIDNGESNTEQVKPKIDVQRKEYQGSEQNILKSTTSTNDSLNSETLGLDTTADLKTILPSCKDSTVTISTTISEIAPKSSQNLFEKSSTSKDSKIPTSTVEKMDILSKTSSSTKGDAKAIKQDQNLGTVDKGKKNVSETSFGRFSSHEPAQEKSIKISNGKTFVSSVECKKSSPNGLSEKPDVPSNKESVVCTSGSTDIKNNDRSTKARTSFSFNKQLQRQKKTTVEDNSEAEINMKNVDITSTQKDQVSKVNISVKADPEKQTKSAVPSQSVPTTSVAMRSIITTTSIKPSTTISEKTSPVTSVPIGLPNIASSAKSSLTTTKNVVSDKDHLKYTMKAVGEVPKSKNSIKSSQKDSLTDVKKGTTNQVVTSPSSKLPETSQSVPKTALALKSESRVMANVSDSHKNTVPQVASCVSTVGSTATSNKSSVSQTFSVGKGSLNSSSKSAVKTSTPSSTSSTKVFVAANKKIEPLFSEKNKDSRA